MSSVSSSGILAKDVWKYPDRALTTRLNTFTMKPPVHQGTIGVTSGSNPWQFGSWTQILAPNEVTSDFVIIGIGGGWINSTGYEPVIVEIGIGDAGSEITIIELPLQAYPYSCNSVDCYPVKIPANTRVAARIATWAWGTRQLWMNLRYFVL